MRFISKNMWALAAFALVAFVAMTGDACAQGIAGGGGSVMSIASSKMTNVFTHVRTIVFILGGFGLVGVAFAAIFGKVDWKWFAALAVGLAILAAANAVVKYTAGERMGGSLGGSVTDTIYSSGE
ncbi:MAG: TrbC/VirB2 family protein [Rhodospirillales bacterium]|nr:TrbC/VirB2 family protein [Rhodospirillales bacterium]